MPAAWLIVPPIDLPWAAAYHPRLHPAAQGMAGAGIRPLVGIGAALGAWPAISVAVRVKPWPLGLLAGVGVLAGTVLSCALAGWSALLIRYTAPGSTAESERGSKAMGISLMLVAAVMFVGLFSQATLPTLW
jgi:hypothetical protein